MANTLNEYQQRVVDEVERNICVISSAASGKAICNSDVVPTPEGMRKVSDIREGDYLFDRLGRPTKVLGVFPQGEKEVYEITFGDGRTARCSDEHIWRVNKSTWKSKNKWKDMTLKEIMSEPLIDNSRGAYFRIPNSHAVEYSKKDYKVNPYIIGAFLGDGCCLEHALTISCGDSEVAEHIAELLGENVTVKKQSESNYSYVFYSNGISIKTKGALPEELITYSYNKYIPIEYKYGSKEQRIELINGLFDTDGSCTIGNRKGHKLCSNVTFSTTSKRLAEDVKEVLGSLGIISDISLDKRTEKYTSGNCFTVYARIPNELKPDFFYIERKKNIARTTENEFQKKSFDTTTIRKIESLGYKEEMTCFYVDNDEHLFLMNDFIVTHNTEVITRRVLNIVNGHGVDPSRILCVSFSKDASVTLNQRFEKNGVKGVNCKTFHALALSIVKLVYPSKQIWTKDYEKINVIKKICVNNKFCLNQNSVPTGEIMAYITSRQMKVPCQVELSLDEDTMKEIFDLYNEFKVSKNLIEFNDMVDMAVEILKEKPVVREKYENLYDYIMMDEFQDVSADQYEFAKMLGKKANMMVVGDVQQCQPEGTKVMLRNGVVKPIEEIKAGDSVVWYDSSKSYLSGIYTTENRVEKRVKQVASRDFCDDNLITIFTENGESSSYTPNHICFAKLRKSEYNHAVYLMCDDNYRFRIGKIILTAEKTFHSNPWRHKMYDEGCSKIWILKSFKTDLEARVLEQKLSYKYSIPQTCWQTDKVLWTKEDIDYIYEGLDTYKSAELCLKEFNRDIKYPLLDKEMEESRNIHYARNAVAETYAANLMPENMEVIVYDRTKSRRKRYEKISKIEYKHITEPIKVYSLEVEGGTYVADNIVTHNCIYGFRGGLSKFMLSFIEDFNAVRMFLPVNYRCNDKIVEMANCLTHVSKDAIANKYIDSIPFRKSDVVPDILTFPNSELEKNFVLSTIKDKKFAYKDNLILARTNRQLYDIFSYLIENNIPCKLIGSLPFYKLSEIATILSYLKFLNNTDNNQAFMTIINKPNRYIPKTLIEGIEECTGYGESMYERMVSGEGIELKYMRNIMELRNFVNKFNLQTFHNVKEIIEYIVEELELNICLTERCSDAEAVNSVLENIDTLKSRCEKYPTIKDFLMAVKKEYEACGKIDDKTDAVILETIHKSKGAEAPRVFVTGFSEGLLPHANAISEEEELHIFYVAVTRARDELHIMHSNNVGIKKLSISRFAKYVEDYIVC